ncbi:phosphate regulon sensor histidine kinase PhoR [Aurantivibrio infirmus]
MHRGFATEIRRVIILTGLCIGFGLINGYLAWTLIAGGAIYMGWTLWQIFRLDRWIIAREPGLPPDASGIWGDIFDRIYHLQRRREREALRLQAVLTRVQETVAALPDGVILLDSRGCMTWWNDNASELLAFQSGDLQTPLVNFIRDPQFIEYYENQDYRLPFEIPSPQHKAKRLQIQITHYGHGERLVLLRDITRIYRLEKMRKDFVANVSHEMRTPLTVIKGYVETLADHAGEVAPTWEKPIVQIQQQTDRMNLLVNDLITLSRLETEDTQGNQTTVNLAQLVNAVKSEAEVVGKHKYQVSADCDPKILMKGNQKELHSAVSNLVINAIKYSPPGTDIQINVRVSEEGIEVEVVDNGIGIDDIHLSRLTERFYRVDASRSINTGGTGLGLAIVKHVLLRHDGTLHIDSEPGKGSCFTCLFPLSRLVSD